MKRSERLAARRYTLEPEVAPHVEEEWAEAMLLELRLRGIAGPRIGAALAEVDSHCLESGQSAEDAFGDPVAYARSLELPETDGTSPRALLGATLPIATQVIGMIVLLWSFTDWREARQLEITTGHLAVAAIILIQMAAVVRWPDPALRTIVRRPVLAWISLMAGIAAVAGVYALLTAVVWRLPAVAAIVAGAVVLVAGVVADLVRQRSTHPADDPVVAPLAPAAGTASSHALARTLGRVVTWQVPMATAALLATTWWMTG